MFIGWFSIVTTMRRTMAVVGLVTLTILGGCLGPGGADGQAGTNAREQTTQTDVGTDTNPSSTAASGGSDDGEVTGTSTVAGEHPYMQNGSMSYSTLLRDHVTSLESSGSISMASNRTAYYVANDTLAVRIPQVREMKFDPPEAVFLQRQELPDGTLTREIYRTGERSCIRETSTERTPSVECHDTSTSSQRLLGYTVETTSLETLAALSFRPEGTDTRDGQQLYRYRASSLRSGVPADQKLGDNVTLDSATLLVSPDGRIVRYEVTYQRASEGTQYRITDVYRTWKPGETSVTRPTWIP